MMSAIGLSKALDKLTNDKRLEIIITIQSHSFFSLTESAKKLRRQIELRPVSSSNLLIKWTEFVAEFKTLDNLVPYGVHLNAFVYHSLDVISFLLFSFLFIAFLIYRICLKCYRCVKCFIPEDHDFKLKSE